MGLAVSGFPAETIGELTGDITFYDTDMLLQNVCGPMFDKWTKNETLQEAQAKMDLS